MDTHTVPKRWDDDVRRRAREGKITHKELESWVKRAKPKDALPFGGNLQLVISKAGTPLWHTYYRIKRPDDGGLIERTFSHGPFSTALGYADVSKEHDRVKAQLHRGIDPVQERYVARATQLAAGDNVFEKFMREWVGDRKRWSAVHRKKSVRALERDVLPYLGRLPVDQITPSMVTAVIERIMRRGAQDTPAKVLQHITRIFRLAQTRGLKENPAIPVREKLPERVLQKRYPALLKWSALGDVLRDVESTRRLSPAVQLAHRLCAFTAARISNVVGAEWKEFQLEAEPPRWEIPRAKMKAQDRAHDHKIILGPTIAAELRAWRSVGSGKGYVFPSPAGGKHITRESIEKLYRVTLGLEGKHTPHGWRSSFSTLARDEGGFARDVVELALDHVHDTDVVRAYDRGERLEQRIRLMHWWDEHLSRAQHGAVVVPLNLKTA